MANITHLLISLCYYSSKILGLLAFSYDPKSRRFSTNSLSTWYCAFIRLVVVAIILRIVVDDLYQRNDSISELHQQVWLAIYVIRIASVLISVVFNWTQREKFMQTFNDLEALREYFHKKWPKWNEGLESEYNRSIKTKFLWSFLANMGYALEHLAIWRTQHRMVALFVMTFLNGVISVIMTHYFNALANVSILLIAINKELQGILDDCDHLVRLRSFHRIGCGFLMTQCCQFSDEIDELARIQYQIQLLFERTTNLFDIQVVMVLLTVYMNNIAVYYILYVWANDEHLWRVYSHWSLYLVPLVIFCYYMDIQMSRRNMLQIEEQFFETARLLKERALWWPMLDSRLEESVSWFLGVHKIIDNCFHRGKIIDNR